MSYLGSKGGNGVCQFLINNIPKHEAYYELFAGSAQLFLAKKRADFNILNDIDINAPVFSYDLDEDTDLLYNMCYKKYIDTFGFTSEEFIYLDPPYPFSSRKDASTCKYDFEMTDRGGVCIEQIYMNYDEPTELHEYTYLGSNATDRQRINRKVKRHIDRLKQLQPQERNKILFSIKNEFEL